VQDPITGAMEVNIGVVTYAWSKKEDFGHVKGGGEK
jgi:hypothetical protein